MLQQLEYKCDTCEEEYIIVTKTDNPPPTLCPYCGNAHKMEGVFDEDYDEDEAEEEDLNSFGFDVEDSED